MSEDGARPDPRLGLAALVIAAEVGHLFAVVDEWPVWVLRGIFHTAAAMALGVLAASLLVGSGRKALRRGAVLTLLLPAVWLFSRTAGFPSLVTLHRLPIRLPDALTTAVEIALAVLLIAELRRRPREVNERVDPSPQLERRDSSAVARVGLCGRSTGWTVPSTSSTRRRCRPSSGGFD